MINRGQLEIILPSLLSSEIAHASRNAAKAKAFKQPRLQHLLQPLRWKLTMTLDMSDD